MTRQEPRPLGGANLTVEGRVVGVYESGESMPVRSSPRPFLRMWTLGGDSVTDTAPEDHPHHMGLSAALPDVGGSSFWGGRTFVRGEGSVMRDNHGVQRITRRSSTAESIDEQVLWGAADGVEIIREERSISAHRGELGWHLRWRSRLRAARGGLSIGNPDTNGRAGAFYGGLFWRTPFSSADVMSSTRHGVAEVHGEESPWISIRSERATLVAVAAPDPGPWFVRADEYVGFGPATAVRARRELPLDSPIDLEMTVAVLDGRLEERAIRAVARTLVEGNAA